MKRKQEICLFENLIKTLLHKIHLAKTTKEILLFVNEIKIFIS